MSNKPSLDEALSDSVLDLPREFFIGEDRYVIWNPTLGVSILAERRLANININQAALSKNPGLEALRLVSMEKEKICELISLHTFRDFADLSNSNRLSERSNIFHQLNKKELAELFLLVLSFPNASTLIQESGLANEQERQAEIAKYKNKDGHSVTFGGKTIYGMLIDAACNRYGWNKEYVVWGIDLVSLRMMLADSINSVYLNDDEMKALNINSTSNQKFGMTKEDIEKLKELTKD